MNNQRVIHQEMHDGCGGLTGPRPGEALKKIDAAAAEKGSVRVSYCFEQEETNQITEAYPG